MRNLTIAAFLILSFALMAHAGEHEDRLDDWYKPDTWEGKDSKNKPGFNLGGLKLDGCDTGELEHQPKQPSRREFKKDGKPAFNAFVKVCKSADAAHKLLLAFLGNVSIDEKMKRLSELELSIGHIGYIFSQDGKTHWIAFVRNNVLVLLMITNVKAELDLVNFAEVIDKEIDKQDDVSELPMPEIKTCEAQKNSIALEEKVALNIDVKSNADGDVDLHFEIKGEGQGHIEKGDDGKYYFKGTGKGKVKIIVISTNSLCNQTESEIEISIN
ncbi:MAG: hypothetical protein K8S87_00690 [Planctomycetes bacterium]|nr:hypothetical protein [Planctomycetota bacterium]